MRVENPVMTGTNEFLQDLPTFTYRLKPKGHGTKKRRNEKIKLPRKRGKTFMAGLL